MPNLKREKAAVALLTKIPVAASAGPTANAGQTVSAVSAALARSSQGPIELRQMSP